MTIKSITRLERAPGDVVGSVLPAGPPGAAGSNGSNGTNGTNGVNGTNGSDGANGWSPVFATVSDSARRVLQVVDWTGGTGSKPTTGQYVAATGLTSVLADAVDLRGPQGAPGASGSGTGDMVRSTYDTNADGKVNSADHADAADAVPWTGVSGKPTFAAVATSGAYADLTGKPSIGAGDMTKAVYDTTNNGKVDAAEAADSVPWTGVSGKPTFASVATSGSYSDLTGKPTLGTASGKDFGTSPGQLVEVQTGNKLPALDGSLLSGIVATPPTTFGAVGTPVFARYDATSNGALARGATVSGANLIPAYLGTDSSAALVAAADGSTTLSGTWRLMSGGVPGNLGGADTGFRYGVFARIS